MGQGPEDKGTKAGRPESDHKSVSERVPENPRTVENRPRFYIPSVAVGQARSLRGPRRPALRRAKFAQAGLKASRRRMAPPHVGFHHDSWAAGPS